MFWAKPQQEHLKSQVTILLKHWRSAPILSTLLWCKLWAACASGATTTATIRSRFQRQQSLGDSWDYQTSQGLPVCQEPHQGLTPLTIHGLLTACIARELLQPGTLVPGSPLRPVAAGQRPWHSQCWDRFLFTVCPGLFHLCPAGHRCLPTLHVCSPPTPTTPALTPQDHREGKLWDRLVVGSRLCSGLLAPGVVAGGRHWPSAGTSRAAGGDDRWGRWPALKYLFWPAACSLSLFTEVVFLPKVWPTLPVCTCTSTASSGLKSTAITVVSYGCQERRVGGNLKQSTWKRPPLHLYSAPIILVPPLPASRLLRSPPTLHYQLPKASLPRPALAFVSVTTLASAIYTLHALCQILLRAGGTLQLKTEASAALDQSTYFKGVAMECKTWKEREKPNTAFVTHWAKVCANVAQGSLRSVRLFVILCLQGRTFPSCCTRAWARQSTSGSCGRVGDWHLLSKREGIPLPPRQIQLWMWMDTDTALGPEAAICSVWADPTSAVFTVRSHSNKRKSEWMKGECHV